MLLAGYNQDKFSLLVNISHLTEKRGSYIDNFVCLKCHSHSDSKAVEVAVGEWLL